MNKPTLYTQNGCGMCRAIHMLLDKKNIDHNEVIITPDNVDEFKAKGITATPTLEVDGHLYIKKEASDWVREH